MAMGLVMVDSGQSKGERGGTAFPHFLFLVYTVPPPEFEGYCRVPENQMSVLMYIY